MDRNRRDTFLGLMFFGTLALLLWATLNLRDVSFGRLQPLTVFFPNAGNLRLGDAVTLLGKRVGKVADIEYHKEREANKMQVVLRLDEEVPLTDAGMRIEIQDSSVLGGKQVYIDPGNGRPLAPGTQLIGQSLPNPLERVGRTFDGEGNTGIPLREALEGWRDFMKNLNDPQTSIGALVRSREMYNELLGVVQGIHRVVNSIDNGDGILGRVIKDTVLRDDAMRFVANLRTISEALTGTEGTIPRLLNDRAMAANVSQALADLATMIADTKNGDGTLGMLLRDPRFAGDLRDAVANLNAALRRLNDPEAGLLGRLLADPEIGTDAKQLIAGLRQVVAKLNEGNGVLGILINDTDLGMRLRRLVNQVSRAVEDAREAAPIGNFVQVLMGAF
ncbi:MAG TPA: MlaD family protein [Planctomycetota bacterium]|nr:MlaD family protein [Planctomycetota bacterium]